MVRATTWLTAVMVLLGMAAMANAAVDWDGDYDGDGDGWDFNNGYNWDDDVNPSNSSWNIFRRYPPSYPNYPPPMNLDIHITSDITTVTGTINKVAGYTYTVNLTVDNGVTVVNGPSNANPGSLNYYNDGRFTIKSGATYDMRYGQLATETSGVIVTIEDNAMLYCSTLRHNNGTKMDVYGELRAWTVSRIAADPGYRLAVYGGGLFRVDSGVPSAWGKGGKVTQYVCSTVMLAGDQTGNYLNLVQAGEPGVWDVQFEGGYTYIRLLPGPNVCDFSATPEEIESKPGAGGAASQAHQITITNTMVGGQDVNYTITVLKRNRIEVDVADIPWLSIDKLSGGPIAPNGTDVVTATVDYTKLEVGLNTVTLRFKCDCDPCEVHDVEITAPFIMVYNGDVEPDSMGSAGSGLQFALAGGVNQGSVLTSAPDTLDGFAWQLFDVGGQFTKWRTSPFQNLGATTGATIVGRLRVATAVAPNSANLLIDHSSYACGLHWRGNGSAVDPVWRPGVLQELERNGGLHDPPNLPSTVQLGPEEYDAPYNLAYHVFRMTGAECLVKIYVDENPMPVITIDSCVAGSTDGLGFGATNSLSWQQVWFDWVTGTNAGAFAPGEEVARIGRSLCLGPECGPCNSVVFADADKDGDVDQVDFGMFQQCFTGDGGGLPAAPPYCGCFDWRNNDGLRGNDGDVDGFDMGAFEDCASGSGVPADPECDE